MIAERLLSSFGSATTNLFMFSFILAGWHSGVRPCPPALCGGPRAEVSFVPAFLFRPFIDNPGRYSDAPDSDPRCPHPQVRGRAFDLEEAPLPSGFDPMAHSRKRLLACIRLDSSGNVFAVRLIGVGAEPNARPLASNILRRWRFSPSAVEEGKSGWVRVRLNAGPMDVPMIRYYGLE